MIYMFSKITRHFNSIKIGIGSIPLDSDETWLRGALPLLWIERNETPESLTLFEYQSAPNNPA